MKKGQYYLGKTFSLISIAENTYEFTLFANFCFQKAILKKNPKIKFYL